MILRYQRLTPCCFRLRQNGGSGMLFVFNPDHMYDSHTVSLGQSNLKHKQQGK